MTRKGYRAGIAWIASHEAVETTDVDEVAGFMTVRLLADLFDKEPEAVARDVLHRIGTMDSWLAHSAGWDAWVDGWKRDATKNAAWLCGYDAAAYANQYWSRRPEKGEGEKRTS